MKCELTSFYYAEVRNIILSSTLHAHPGTSAIHAKLPDFFDIEGPGMMSPQIFLLGLDVTTSNLVPMEMLFNGFG